ncbi:MAG TPA: hypothetical protein VMT32_05965 [Bryobacteraceae bacterium]|nr:hypothetical protein [Bryobacteraceae bacterium]
MNGMTNSSNGRIEQLRQKEKEIRERIAQEKVRAARRKEKNDAKLFSVIGRALLKYAAQTPDFELMLRQTLQSVVTDEHERRFLASCGWL